VRISDSQRLLFVHVQKTGGVTVEKVLGEVLPDVRPLSRGSRLRHHTMAQALDAEPALVDYWTFGFVRNPWARMVSWWSMIQSMKTRAAAGGRNPQRMLDTNKFLAHAATYADFDEFVMKGTEELARLRRPQINYLRTPTKRAEFIGRTESFADDLQKVLDHLGAEPPASFPHANQSSHGHHREYYTDQTRDRIGTLFAPDLDEFGYEF
jgi:hypothetical protein